ncbi:hypothetical protein LSAT2_016213 [Lamellibrachia satsuma]|nr:hypothetical protein LSAT2_016213 [Lamellibrachia satsuma]
MLVDNRSPPQAATRRRLQRSVIVVTSDDRKTVLSRMISWGVSVQSPDLHVSVHKSEDLFPVCNVVSKEDAMLFAR